MELEHELTRRIATRIIRIKIQHCILREGYHRKARSWART